MDCRRNEVFNSAARIDKMNFFRQPHSMKIRLQVGANKSQEEYDK